ncbi:hypothetical protein Ciccas_007134 [Cichlidogyrus casuarinus]|uniref:Uncharacterized protein n=1 Tax=Cichlidogyrus casuarinus TaxID=1844966 RepID=A0ABD2Q3R0_9PLAT
MLKKRLAKQTDHILGVQVSVTLVNLLDHGLRQLIRLAMAVTAIYMETLVTMSMNKSSHLQIRLNQRQLLLQLVLYKFIRLTYDPKLNVEVFFVFPQWPY